MVTTISNYDPTLFQGAAWYYARYRAKYPQALFDLLADVFNLDGTERLLDPDADMLTEAQEQAVNVGATNIRWIHDRAESISEDLGEFKLVTMGRSFHWMQRELVLSKLDSLVNNDGGIVIIKTNENSWESQHPWKQTAITASSD